MKNLQAQFQIILLAVNILFAGFIIIAGKRNWLAWEHRM